jgi:protein O-GlcNAc transferase
MIIKNKIRVAYVSSDFGAHPVSYLTAGLFELHNRDKFEIHAISLKNSKSSDLYRQRILSAADEFIDISDIGNEDALKLLRSKNYDIAFDLNGHTAFARTILFIKRFAKIQINYLGYVGTMGHESYDYLIADDYVIPLEHSEFYVEKILCLPFFQANDYKRVKSNNDISRNKLDISEDSFVYCSLNSNYKLNKNICLVWVQILISVENSILVIYISDDLVKNNLIKFFNQNAVGHKIRWIHGTDYSTYLTRYDNFDLFLDTNFYNGGTTVSDALWAGVPVITLQGDSFASRMAASILKQLNMDECISRNYEDYFHLAVFYSNKNNFEIIKKKAMAAKFNKIFNTKWFISQLENALIAIYKNNNINKYTTFKEVSY